MDVKDAQEYADRLFSCGSLRDLDNLPVGRRNNQITLIGNFSIGITKKEANKYGEHKKQSGCIGKVQQNPCDAQHHRRNEKFVGITCHNLLSLQYGFKNC
jgi:hypothetical protein